MVSLFPSGTSDALMASLGFFLVIFFRLKSPKYEARNCLKSICEVDKRVKEQLTVSPCLQFFFYVLKKRTAGLLFWLTPKKKSSCFPVKYLGLPWPGWPGSYTDICHSVCKATGRHLQCRVWSLLLTMIPVEVLIVLYVGVGGSLQNALILYSFK